ncbi:MAG: glucosamine inositolphosphorylceramide transferase family protein [Planctomycetota bacterium]
MATSKARDADENTAAEIPPAVLRVGLLVDSLVLPRWKRRIIEEISACSVARIAVVARGAAPRPRRFHPLLYDLYRGLDYRLFRGEGTDAFAPSDVSDLLADCPVVADTGALAGLDLDVAVRLGSWWPDGDVARHGVWSLPDDTDVGFSEVMEARPTTPSFLEIRTGRGAPRVVALSHSPTDHISVHRTRNHTCWKSASFVARTLRHLAHDGPAALEGEAAPAARPRPGNLAVCGLVARLALRYVRRKVGDLLTREQWYPAYRFEAQSRAPSDAFAGLARLVPPKDRFWADPFPFVKDGRTYLFLEELPYRRGKGHISVLEIDAEHGAREPVEVLKRDYHLSYPFVFEWQGEVYLLPETAADRKVQLFRCRSFPDTWEEDRVLLDGVNAVDATLAEVDGRWWMFVNIGAPGAGNWDELHLYHADTPLGPWTPHRRNPVKSDCRAARPAGRLFRWQDQLYRPAQDCSGTYGAAIALHKILRLTPDAYAEEHVADLVPEWAERAHTLNTGTGLHVVDVLQRRRRFP